MLRTNTCVYQSGTPFVSTVLILKTHLLGVVSDGSGDVFCWAIHTEALTAEASLSSVEAALRETAFVVVLP